MGGLRDHTCNSSVYVYRIVFPENAMDEKSTPLIPTDRSMAAAADVVARRQGGDVHKIPAKPMLVAGTVTILNRQNRLPDEESKLGEATIVTGVPPRLLP